MRVDFGPTAIDYARHRVGFPASFFDSLTALGLGRPGQEVIDLGTGTGDLARGFALRGCRVIGVDPAAPLLEQARALDRALGVTVEYRLGTAEASGLPDESADVVSAGQCWVWFDRPVAMQETARLLRRDGTLVIAHFDWLPLAGNLVEATERIIKAHYWTWRRGGGNGMHPAWLRELGEAGYRDLRSFTYDVDVPYTHEGWRGRVRAHAAVGATLSENAVRRVDRAVADLLVSHFPDGVLLVPHRVFAVVARRPVAHAVAVRAGRRGWARSLLAPGVLARLRATRS